jgi:hypothetical protein
MSKDIEERFLETIGRDGLGCGVVGGENEEVMCKDGVAYFSWYHLPDEEPESHRVEYVLKCLNELKRLRMQNSRD